MILFVLFAETGLFLGFFLPGDSLLFAAGLYINEIAGQFFNSPFYIIIVLAIIATAAGSFLGYWIGFKTGPLMFRKKDTFLFRKKHLLKAKEFYDKHGKMTIFVSKFIPIIRTFAPLVAGITKMPVKTFSGYNIAGSILWAAILMLAGHFLQTFALKRFDFDLKNHIEYITLIIVIITTLPVLIKLFIGNKKNPAIIRGVGEN